MPMRLLDLPKELFGGDAHKEGRTTKDNVEIANGAGIAKYLDARSLAMFACVSRECREAAKTMKADLPVVLGLHLVRLTPQMRALTTKSLLHNLGRGNEWAGSEAEKALLEVKTQEDLVQALELVELDEMQEWEDHLPEHAAVIADVESSPEELFEALKTDTRTHRLWDMYAQEKGGERWHQMPDPSFVEMLRCEALQIYPMTVSRSHAHQRSLPLWRPDGGRNVVDSLYWPDGFRDITSSLWCGRIDVEKGELEGGWGLIFGPRHEWCGRGIDHYWEIVRDAPNWD